MFRVSGSELRGQNCGLRLFFKINLKLKKYVDRKLETQNAQPGSIIMIRFSLKNLICAVNLFHKKQADHLMRKSHFG